MRVEKGNAATWRSKKDRNLMGDLSSCEYLRRWWISRGFVVSENRVKIGKSENQKIDDVIKKSENQKIDDVIKKSENRENQKIEKIRKSENQKIDDVIKKSENRSGAFAHAYEYRK